MDDEPSKLQEEACGARPQGPHAPEADIRDPDLANVVVSLIEVASGNETFLGAGLAYWSVRRSALDYGVGQHSPPSFKGVSRLAFTARIG